MNSHIEPLSRYTRLSTRDPEELECFLATKNLEVEVSTSKPHRPKLDSVINAYYLPNTYVSYLRYRTPVALIARGDRPDFSLSLPAKGSFSLNLGSKEILGGKDVGTLGSPTYDQRTVLNEDSSRYGISLSQNIVVRMLESMLGKPLSAPLQFTPKVELQTSAGRSLTSLINMFVKDVSSDIHAFGHSMVSMQFEQLLISMLLANQPHNYSKALSTPTPSLAPRDVKRVLDYIQEHLPEPISLPELVAISGVPGSSLFAHFKKFTGKSPLNYVCEQRLARARQNLINGKRSDTVTAIATRWGFTQLGRFSGLYCKTYGELPRETLRRAQNNLNITQLH